MTLLETQILTLFKDGCKAEDISLDLGLELSAVKYALSKWDTSYRKEVRKPTQELISDSDMEEISAAYKDIALNPEYPPEVRERALKFCWNEYKGRNDLGTINADGQTGMNFIVFNQTIQASKEKTLQRLKTLPKSPMLIDVGFEREDASEPILDTANAI